MAFLGGLFKKKAGGSLVGNLIRAATGGVTGAPPTQYDIDKRDLSDSDFLKKYGTDKNGVPQSVPGAGATPAPSSAPIPEGYFRDKDGTLKPNSEKPKWYKNPWILLGIATGVGLIVYLIMKAGKGRRRRY